MSVTIPDGLADKWPRLFNSDKANLYKIQLLHDIWSYRNVTVKIHRGNGNLMKVLMNASTWVFIFLNLPCRLLFKNQVNFKT